MIQNGVRAALAALCLLLSVSLPAIAAPYAAFVMDARTGAVLYEKNADRRLHPASLTKMMTLYLVFDAVERGQLGLDQMITISAKAASQPPSKLGLKAGQKIALRYLIRAAAVKSANDAAMALGEAVSGSQAEFADLMNATAAAMGMTNTTFRNPNGLTQDGHLSTARDMAILGRRVFYDFPQYYNIFSREQTSAGVGNVNNTNRRFLDNYEGADGIKTGYTNAAGYNLVASAQRGQERIIASMFGGTSTSQRNAKVAELLDLGFKRAPSNAELRMPPRLIIDPGSPDAPEAQGTLLAATSIRPKPRPGVIPIQIASNYDGMADAVAAALELAAEPVAPDPQAQALMDEAAAAVAAELAGTATTAVFAPAQSDRPRPRTRVLEAEPEATIVAAAESQPASGGGAWSVQLGAYSNRGEAERLLLTTALQDLQALEGAEREIDSVKVGGVPMYRARFAGLSQDEAENACARLIARSSPCEMLAPGT
jgi:D-alanyl-D-alanine carboxypeptidase